MEDKKQLHKERLTARIQRMQANNERHGRIGYMGHEFYVKISPTADLEAEVEKIIELYNRAVNMMVRAVRKKNASMFMYNVYPGSASKKPTGSCDDVVEFVRFTSTPIAAVFSEVYHMEEDVTGAIISVEFDDDESLFKVTTKTTKA